MDVLQIKVKLFLKEHLKCKKERLGKTPELVGNSNETVLKNEKLEGCIMKVLIQIKFVQNSI